jgi:HD-like signal output (HDOD) protein/GGDEF domain-containing protein
MSTALDPRLEAMLAQADRLPTLPGVALEVLRLCRAEETTLDDLARALSSDPAMAARLLRFANSSLYGCGEEVRTLQRATLVLGMKTVQLMSLSFSLVHAVPREGNSGGYDYASYWRRSLVRAVSARALAGRIGSQAQDEAFLSGLLAEIGQVVMARCMPEPFEELLREVARRGQEWPSAVLERECLGFDHGDVGGALLAAWQLPSALLLSVRHAEDPARLPQGVSPEVLSLVRVLALASHAADLLTLRDSGALARVHTQAEAWFGLRSAEIGELLLALEAPIRETAELLELKLPGERGHEQILSEAREQLVRRGFGRARELESLRAVGDVEHRTRLLAAPENHDPLTGAASALAFQHVLELELRARLDGDVARPLGLLLAEIDGLAGLDEEARGAAQRALAGCLARLTRKQDLCARIAPGRFALLSSANPFGQRVLAERLREEVARLCLPLAGGELAFRVSLGGVCLGSVRHAGDGSALCDVAERLLARAQARGGDTAEVHPQLLQPR